MEQNHEIYNMQWAPDSFHRQRTDSIVGGHRSDILGGESNRIH